MGGGIGFNKRFFSSSFFSSVFFGDGPKKYLGWVFFLLFFGPKHFFEGSQKNGGGIDIRLVLSVSYWPALSASLQLVMSSSTQLFIDLRLVLSGSCLPALRASPCCLSSRKISSFQVFSLVATLGREM